MATTLKINFVLASLGLILLFNVATAQQSSSTSTEAVVSSSTEPNVIPEIFSCHNATAQTVNATLLLGQWYEAARKTYPNADNDDHNKAQCVGMDFLNSTNLVDVNVTYSVNPDKLNVNQTKNYPLGVHLTSNLVEGVYNINGDGYVKTYKIVATDYENYAFVCGYPVAVETTTTTESSSSTESTVSSSSSSSTTVSSTTTAGSSTTSTTTQKPEIPNVTEAYILIRNRFSNATVLNKFMTEASTEFLDFKNLTTVIQSEKCENGAATLVPMLTLMLAIVLAIIKV